jgi:hypothetical protein
MKKSLVALAALAATTAFAQVTITGGVSSGFATVNGAKSVQGIDEVNSNSFIFTASEDLGGGMKAKAVIQQRLTAKNVDKESGDLYVNLSGSFGSVQMGKYTFLSHSGYNPFASRAVTSTGGSASAINGTDYNASYTTPTMAGFSASANVAQTGTAGDQTSVAYKANYANGPLTVQVGLSTAALTDATRTTAIASKTTSFGAVYDAGMAKLYVANFSRAAGSTGASAKNEMDSTSYGIAVPMGALTFRAGVLDSTDKGTTADTTILDRTSMGVDYALSKRTTFTAELANQKVAKDASASQRNYFVGLSHAF